jgi:membrane protein implicated in regulation of membrane protease activity
MRSANKIQADLQLLYNQKLAPTRIERRNYVGREVRMPVWAWLVMAAMLLSAEMFLVDAQFYLVFFGVAAAIVGVLGYVGIALPEAGQWLLFALLSVVAMLTFRKRLYERLRKPVGDMPGTFSPGDRVQLSETLAPGQSCRVEYEGSSWTARNIDQQPISGEVSVAHIEGLTLMVRQG